MLKVKKQKSPIKINAVAIKLDGIVHSRPPPARHNEIWLDLIAKKLKAHLGEQGFLTSESNFVNRTQALKIAQDAGQVRRDPLATQLFSEDLW